MKLFPILYLLALSLVQEGTSIHLENCECHEIRELMNASVQQVVARLENSLGITIDTAISNINTTNETALFFLIFDSIIDYLNVEVIGQKGETGEKGIAIAFKLANSCLCGYKLWL